MKIKKSSYVSLTAILGLFLCLPSFALGKAEPVEHLTLTSIKAETLAENQYIQGKVYMTNIENVDRYKKLLLRIILKCPTLNLLKPSVSQWEKIPTLLNP